MRIDGQRMSTGERFKCPSSQYAFRRLRRNDFVQPSKMHRFFEVVTKGGYHPKNRFSWSGPKTLVFSDLRWSGWRDSNPRPLRPERNSVASAPHRLVPLTTAKCRFYSVGANFFGRLAPPQITQIRPNFFGGRNSRRNSQAASKGTAPLLTSSLHQLPFSKCSVDLDTYDPKPRGRAEGNGRLVPAHRPQPGPGGVVECSPPRDRRDGHRAGR